MTTPQFHVKADSIWMRKGPDSTGRVEVLESIIQSGEHWLQVRHLDMPASKTKTWWTMARRFLKKYEPSDL